MRVHFLVFYSHTKPKSELRIPRGAPSAAEDRSTHPAWTALSYLPFASLDLTEVVTSGVLVTARTLCLCEHNHFALKREKAEA